MPSCSRWAWSTITARIAIIMPNANRPGHASCVLWGIPPPRRRAALRGSDIAADRGRFGKIRTHSLSQISGSAYTLVARPGGIGTVRQRNSGHDANEENTDRAGWRPYPAGEIGRAHV